jgi:CubicO group peptidase (beta-lactamase class C family)
LLLQASLLWGATASAQAQGQGQAQAEPCAEPAALGDGLVPQDAAVAGFDKPALCQIIDEARARGANIHSVLVLRRGRLVAEAYMSGTDETIWSLWGGRKDLGPASLHDMRSTTKSIVGLLYGILLAKRQVPNLETPVASLYPRQRGIAGSAKAAIRIRHLMTMSSGLAWEEASPVHRVAGVSDELGLLWRTDPYPYVFGFDVVAAPGQTFVYSGGATTMIADIMVQATGKPLLEIAQAQLFGPLGIEGWSWSKNLWGTPLAAAGLRLKPRDLVKIGQMLLDHGKWQGRQVVPTSWIEDATRTQIAAGPRDGYGYQFWTREVKWRGRRLPAAATVGNGGQTLLIVPDLDLAVVTTAGNYGSLEGLEQVRAVEQAIVETVR